MKHIVSFLSCFFLLLITFSQKKIRQIDLDHLDTREITLSQPKKSSIFLLPFKKVFVFDKRSDTSLIGLYNEGKRIKAITLEGGTGNYLTHYFNQLLNPLENTGKELVIIIRKLWVSDYIENENAFDKQLKYEKKLMPGIIARLEFYIKEDYQFCPIYRYDTAMMERKGVKDDIPEHLKALIIDASERITQINLADKLSRTKKREWPEIDSFSNNLFLFPILNDVVLKKGVYRSFQEFINNNPFYHNFFIRKEPEGSVLIVQTENMEEVPVRKIWGFCDGDKLYIQCCNNFFELARKEHTFFTLAAKQYTYTQGIIKNNNTKVLSQIYLIDPVLSGTRLSPPFFYVETNTKLLELKPLLLDMETGILY